MASCSMRLLFFKKKMVEVAPDGLRYQSLSGAILNGKTFLEGYNTEYKPLSTKRPGE